MLVPVLTSCDGKRQAALDVAADREVVATGEALIEAIEAGDGELAKALLDLDVPVDHRDALERTSLMIASVRGEGEIVSLLIRKGADVGAEDSTGRTPLAYAVEGNDLSSVVALLEAGANPSVAVDTGGMLVVQALREGKLGAVQLLLENGTSPRSEGPMGETMVELAVENGYLSVLKQLVKRGVRLGEEKGLGRRLLHTAFENERDEVLRYLLSQGVDPNERNERDETLLHAAISSSRLEVLASLEEYGVSLDDPDARGWRPVHLAILSRDYDLLNRLLESGARGDLESGHERAAVSPLQLAFENRLFSMARLLLRYGVPIEDELYRAVERGGRDGRYAVELLLDAGAAPTGSMGGKQDAPLNLAVRTGEWEIAKLLLDAGASVDAVGLSGQTPLHVAVARGDARMAGLLLDMGADANKPFGRGPKKLFLDLVETKGIGKWALQNSSGLTPVMLAADTGNVSVAQQLILHGASTKTSTKVRYNRMWPLTFATRRSDVPMMQTILGRKPGKEGIWVRVDLSQQRAYVFDGEEQIYSSRISTGKRGYRTRTGKFVVTNKYRHWNSTIYGSSMPYFQRLSASDFGFHVGHVPGYPASHGCIRMPYSGAKKLFSLTQVGDYVEIQP